MSRLLQIPAKDVQPGDMLKSMDGQWIKTGGVQPLGEHRVGILTPEGMIGVPDDGLVVVRRGEV